MQSDKKTSGKSASKRLSLILPESTYEEAATIAKSTRRSMTEVVRMGLGLVKVALDTQERGGKLLVKTEEKEGQPEIQLVVLPL